jgi:hypothetical protein
LFLSYVSINRQCENRTILLLPFFAKDIIMKKMVLVSKIRLLLLAIWIGAACFFSFGVAPGVFGIVPSREIAGAVVSRSLMIVNYSGLIISGILLVSSLLTKNGIAIWFERFLIFILFLTATIGQFVISMQLTQIRNQVGRPIEELSIDEPLRIAFNSLHEYSVWVLVTGLLAAIIAFFLISPSVSPEKKETPIIDQFGNIKF